ncbi:MAG: hypothetical protein ABIS15_06950 [Gemmatimonadaceae bacterium]
MLGGLDLRRRQRVPDGLSEQLFLAREVLIDRALGDPGPAGDLVESGVGDPGFAESSKRCLEDLAWPVGGLSAPFRAFLEALLDGYSY